MGSDNNGWPTVAEVENIGSYRQEVMRILQDFGIPVRNVTGFFDDYEFEFLDSPATDAGVFILKHGYQNYLRPEDVTALTEKMRKEPAFIRDEVTL